MTKGKRSLTFEFNQHIGQIEWFLALSKIVEIKRCRLFITTPLALQSISKRSLLVCHLKQMEISGVIENRPSRRIRLYQYFQQLQVSAVAEVLAHALVRIEFANQALSIALNLALGRKVVLVNNNGSRKIRGSGIQTITTPITHTNRTNLEYINCLDSPVISEKGTDLIIPSPLLTKTWRDIARESSIPRDTRLKTILMATRRMDVDNLSNREMQKVLYDTFTFLEQNRDFEVLVTGHPRDAKFFQHWIRAQKQPRLRWFGGSSSSILHASDFVVTLGGSVAIDSHNHGKPTLEIVGVDLRNSPHFPPSIFGNLVPISQTSPEKYLSGLDALIQTPSYYPTYTKESEIKALWEAWFEGL